MADYYGSSSLYSLTGTAADDSFNISQFSVQSGDSITGGGGYDTLVLTAVGYTFSLDVYDFRGVSLAGLSALNIQAGGDNEVDFSSSQFGSGLSNTLSIVAPFYGTTIVVDMDTPGTFSAANWNLSSWVESPWSGPGPTGYDTIQINGTSGADTIVAAPVGSILNGGAGNDTLIADTGVDFSNPNAQTDCLTGGAGADTFVMGLNSGSDVITDFSHADGDRIDLSIAGYASLSDVLAKASQSGADTVIPLGMGQVTVVNTTLTDLTASDFIFSTGKPTYQPIVVTGTVTGTASLFNGPNGGLGAYSVQTSGYLALGTVTIQDADANTAVTGVRLDGWFADVSLGGILRVTSTGGGGSAVAVDGGGTYVTVLNSEEIDVAADGAATGIAVRDGGRIYNAATISVSSAHGEAIGVLRDLSPTYDGPTQNPHTTSYYGSLTVSGLDAYGFDLVGGNNTVSIGGGVLVTSTGGGHAYGIRIGDPSADTETITNGSTGTLHAEYALNAVGSAATVLLTNQGAITGEIVLGSGSANQIVNTGAINGAIHLSTSGDDLYDGRGGTQSGGLILGGGHDTVYLGDDGETVQGGAGGATVVGGSGDDTITGGAGNDLIDGGAGNDAMAGGGGVNTASFASAGAGVSVSLALQGAAQATGDGLKTLTNFQNLTGSAFNDHLTGDANANVIDGGGGNDVMTGGAGADTFMFRPGYGSDEVTDFNPAQGDRIDLSSFHDLRNFSNVMSLVTQSGANTVISLPGGGSVTVDNVEIASLTPADFVFATTVTAGDFLGTGHASLFWQNSVNNLTSAWLVTDTAPANGVSLPAVSGWQTDDVGNFEGGAYGGDFVLRNTTTGMVDIWQDNGGQMQGHDVAQASLDWQIMGTADFNGDGKSDILWRNEQNGYVSVWQMDGTTVSTTYNPGVVGLEWKLAGAGDFVGDGKAEVLWRNSGTGEVNLWTIDGPGAGQTHGQTVATLPLEWKAAGVGDFNGDGKADILWWDSVTGQVVVWEMNGAQVLAAQPIGDPGPQWKVVDVADITGDGKADILWRDSGTGQVIAWSMNGLNVDHYGALGTVDNTWKVIDHHYDWA